MRHNRKINHLGRTSTHRKAMLANMATSLILHKRIRTTLAKAKALRIYVEPLINRSKEDTTHSRRMVFRYLQSKEAVTELFREISIKVAERPGGYTRILKLGPRLGDSADMALIELVDFNPNLLGEKVEKKGKTTRRGRKVAGKQKETAPVTPKETKSKAEPEPAVSAEEPMSASAVEPMSASAEDAGTEVPEIPEIPEEEAKA